MFREKILYVNRVYVVSTGFPRIFYRKSNESRQSNFAQDLLLLSIGKISRLQ